MKHAFGAVTLVLALAAGTFFMRAQKDVAILPETAGAGNASSSQVISEASQTASSAATGTAALPPSAPPARTGASDDLPPQPQLTNPPAIVKGVYLTGWSAGSPAKVQSIIDLAKRTELNAVVVDIKDYSGYVSYAMDVPEVKASGAEGEIRIARPNALIKQLHDNGIYVIGRITDFQDPILAKAHPEWAMRNKTTGDVWRDNHGLAWLDPAAKPAWEYLAGIARDAFARGFDEVQFDYVRFASDGSIGNIAYPYWDQKISRTKVILSYFKFLRESFPNKRISADLFGLATVNNDDLGIGQVIQSAYEYFDYVSPMVYPSHYAPGFLGYASPAKYPYEVIKYSMEHALGKLTAMGNVESTSATATAAVTAGAASASGTTSAALPAPPFDPGRIPSTKLRPWLQDFNLGGVAYTPAMVRAEKQAVYDVLAAESSSAYYAGWLLWNASNRYTESALDAK